MDHTTETCAESSIRACGIERGVINCAYSNDYASCEKPNGFLTMVSSVRSTLEEICLTL